MQGRFDVTLFDAAGKDDAFFEQAIREGTIDEVLNGLKVEQKAQCSNRIFDNAAGYLLNRLFSLGNDAWPYYINTSGSEALLSFIALTRTSDDTTNYQEDWGKDNSGSDNQSLGDGNGSPPDGVSTTGGKRFEEDQVTGWTIWSDAEREAIHFRNRFLYTTSQGNASDIRSIGIFYHHDADKSDIDYADEVGRIGRVRLKDAAGAPITINKTSSNVLLVEYTFTLVSM